MGATGRPTKLTKARHDKIMKYLRSRIPNGVAAEASGITEETFYAWIRQGREDADNDIDSPFRLFSESIKAIEADNMRFHLDKLTNNVERWQSDAWILERRYQKHFGANVQLLELEKRLKDLEKGEK